MRYEPLPSSFFAGNREELASRLPAGSMLILHANDVFPTNADGTFALHQNANLFYLTGVDQEETVLVMTIREDGWDEILLLRETNEKIAIWEGARLSQEQARELSGIQDVRWTNEYDALLEALVPSASMVFVEANQHPRCTCPVETRNARMTKELKEKFPDAVLKNVYEILADMRQIKKPEEIKALKKACDITNEGFRELLRFIRPGVGEWQIEGFLANEFISRGPRKFSFLPIIASGKDTCVLHYIQNDKRCEDGDLVLMDIGTEYGNYNSDMTRTVPVNGKFTPRQRAVYESVLNMMTYAKKILKPGILKSEYERLVRVFAAGELVKLGLITPAQVAEKPSDPPIVRKYYMHGCSHFLGLDVHDVGEANPVVLPGMVFTVVTISSWLQFFWPLSVTLKARMPLSEVFSKRICKLLGSYCRSRTKSRNWPTATLCFSSTYTSTCLVLRRMRKSSSWRRVKITKMATLPMIDTAYKPIPRARPTQALAQRPAAVVKPLIWFRAVTMMVPAPRKPMPLTTWAPMRTGSPTPKAS